MEGEDREGWELVEGGPLARPPLSSQAQLSQGNSQQEACLDGSSKPRTAFLSSTPASLVAQSFSEEVGGQVTRQPRPPARPPWASTPAHSRHSADLCSGRSGPSFLAQAIGGGGGCEQTLLTLSSPERKRLSPHQPSGRQPEA